MGVLSVSATPKGLFLSGSAFCCPCSKTRGLSESFRNKIVSLGLLSLHLTWSSVVFQVAEEEEEPMFVKICWVLVFLGSWCAFSSVITFLLCRAAQWIVRERLPDLSVDTAWGYIWPLGLLLPDFLHYTYWLPTQGHLDNVMFSEVDGDDILMTQRMQGAGIRD